MKWHRPGKTLFLALFGAVLLWCLVGCATCPAECCETCPPIIKKVTIEKRTQVPAPEIERESEPPFTPGCEVGEDPAGPCWSEDEATADPDGWEEALLADLGAWINSWFRYDDKVAASNSKRPPN